MRVLLINASHPAYNLGLEKAANYWRRQGAEVIRAADLPLLFEVDAVWISAVFSWHVPRLVRMAATALARGISVEVGGPGIFGVRGLVSFELGIPVQATPDARFEAEPGDYKMVFWSRGCPAKNCTLGFPNNGLPAICSVPEMEGWKYTLYVDAKPARTICDNNLSALPRHHQEHIVARTLSAGFTSVDANSGFEPRSIRPWVIDLWKRLPLIAWRFAYDEIGERAAVLKAVAMLDDAGVSRRKLHIYCLAGNEPLEACEQRVHEINELGALPIVQRRRPLTWTDGPLPCLFDWTEQKLIDFQRWGTRLAKGIPFSEYKRGLKDPAPKSDLLFGSVQ